MAEPRPTSSPSSILPPHSSHCDFIPTREHPASLSQMLQLYYLLFLHKIIVQLRNCKLRNLGTVCANTFKFKLIYSIHRHNSKMSHPRCVYINNRCGYQSITQQYLKKMFNKGWSKLYVLVECGHHQVFIRKYGDSALQDWYGYVTMVRSQHLWCLLYAIYKGHRGYLWCVLSWGVQLKHVCSHCHHTFG